MEPTGELSSPSGGGSQWGGGECGEGSAGRGVPGTHSALSNHRLLCLENGQVTFSYKDYSQGGRVREMTLPAEEFIRRFLLHILPYRFVRIRYYGLFANRHRDSELARCRTLLGAEPPAPKSEEAEDWQSVFLRVTGKDPTLCPECGRGHLHVVQELAPQTVRSERPPP